MADVKCCHIKIICIRFVPTNIIDMMIAGLNESATFSYKQSYFITAIPLNVVDVFEFALVVSIGEVCLLLLYFLFL